MPKKPTRRRVVCEFFAFRLFEREGVIYADGRSNAHKLGKHSLGTRDAEEALMRVRQLDRHLAAQHGLAPALPPTQTLDVSLREGWERFLMHCRRPDVLGGVGPKTHQRYCAVRDKHLAFCDDRGICLWSQVSKKSAEEYGAWLDRRQYASRSIFLELTLVKSVVLWLIKGNLLPASGRLDLTLSKPEGTDTYCYSTDEVAAIVGHCRAQSSLRWLADVLVALACTGFRIGELASLRWRDVNLGARTIQLTDDRASQRRRELGSARRIKGRRGRALPIHPDLFEIIVRLERSADHRVFHGPRGGRLKPDTVRTIFVREVIEPLKERFPTSPGEVGFEHGRLHSFRHFFCSQAFLGGASEADIKDWLGHRDSRMVNHYRHLGDQDSQRKMQQIDFLGRCGARVQSSG